MRVALAIHLFLLALEGGLAWHMGGSPFLLTASILAVLVYAPLSGGSGRLGETIRVISMTLFVGFGLLSYRSNPTVLWICLLAALQFLSATQCIWEIQFAGTISGNHSIKIRRSVLTLGFYATLGLAFLMLRADLLEMERSTGGMLAVVSSLAGIVAWELGRAARLEKGTSATTLTGRGFFVRIAFTGLGAMTFVVLFAVVLPLAADALCDFSTKLKSAQNLREPRTRQMLAAQPGNPDEGQSSEELDSDLGPEMTNRTGQAKLPMRGTLELTDEVRVILKFENSSQVEALTKQGPLYVRTVAVGRFENGQWVNESASGHWVKDPSDGHSDGRVEVSKPLTGEISHEVFLPQSTGYALPALAGVSTYALPEVYVLPDNWFQNLATGDIRYKAWSKPINFLSLSDQTLEPGMPGESYSTKLDSPFGARLTESAEFFRTSRTDLSGRLNLLLQFFQTNFKYSKTVENKSNRPPLENFLYEEKKGYCDFFASAAALILRHIGIPSRVAYGYKGGEHDAATDTWIFREIHAHSWTEVFVKDQGWVICDFTPPSNDPLPASEAPPPFDRSKFKDAGEASSEGEIKLWNKAQSLQALQSPWIPAILGLGLLGAIVGFLLGKRRTPEQRAAKKAARERADWELQPAYFLEFLRMCEALGHSHSDGQTLMEFQRYLKHSQFCNDNFDDLADYYYRCRYEDAPQDELSERRFLKRIRQFWKAKASEN